MAVSVVFLGQNPRLLRALDQISYTVLPADSDLRNRRLLFAVAVDSGGPGAAFYAFVRRLRQEPDALRGSMACLVVDGDTELYTKSAAQTLVLAANLAGCRFPGSPLLEATGSLYNQHIQAKNLNLGWEETYFYRLRQLADRLETFRPPKFRRPRVLLLHASDQKRSNTLALGRAVCAHLAPCCEIGEMALLSGTVHDCRGCGYHACLHFAQNDTCFYGGAISEEVLPAVRDSDVLLFLCPNYNDALGANLMDLINRMTSLVVQQSLGDKYLAAVAVSGYSGGDLVARQLLGAMCLNRGVILPPNFCLFQTAHDPGDAMRAEGIEDRVRVFAEGIRREILMELTMDN